MFEQLSQSIAIEIAAPDGRVYKTTAPGSTKIGTLARQFVKAAGGRDHGWKRVVVNRVVVETGYLEALDETLTLTEAGIEDGAKLLIYPEATAGCFTRDTLITLADGSKRRISDISVGDMVLSTLGNGHERSSTRVTKIFHGLSDGHFLINANLRVTGSHPIWCSGNWTRACDLVVGDSLLTEHGGQVTIETVFFESRRSEVLNLSVECDSHTFFANGFLVHNMESKADLAREASLADMRDADYYLYSLLPRIESIESKIAGLEYIDEQVQDMEHRLFMVGQGLKRIGLYLQDFTFTPAPESAKTAQAIVELDSSYDDFDPDRQRQFLEQLCQNLGINKNRLKILKISPGSVVLLLEMTDSAALDFVKAYVENKAWIKAMEISRLEVRPTLTSLAPVQPLSLAQIDVPRIKILFLAANPIDTNRLGLDKEVREIDDALLVRSEFRNMFNISQQWAVRITDLQEHLLRHKPNIVHFSGHGSKQSEIILENIDGTANLVTPESLGRLFALLNEKIQCVVLNACFSQGQAMAIAEHVDCVVGMSRQVEDATAVIFSKAFYRALGYGCSVKKAFDLAVNQIAEVDKLGIDVPQLIATRVDPTGVKFVGSPD